MDVWGISWVVQGTHKHRINGCAQHLFAKTRFSAVVYLCFLRTWNSENSVRFNSKLAPLKYGASTGNWAPTFRCLNFQPVVGSAEVGTIHPHPDALYTLWKITASLLPLGSKIFPSAALGSKPYPSAASWSFAATGNCNQIGQEVRAQVGWLPSNVTKWDSWVERKGICVLAEEKVKKLIHHWTSKNQYRQDVLSTELHSFCCSGNNFFSICLKCEGTFCVCW